MKNIKTLIGVLKFSGDIPADSDGIQRIFLKFSRLYPNFLTYEFDVNGVSQELDEDIETMICDGFVMPDGTKLEILKITQKLKDKFDECKFTDEQIKVMKAMGLSLPKLLKKNTSARYKKLVNSDTED